MPIDSVTLSTLESLSRSLENNLSTTELRKLLAELVITQNADNKVKEVANKELFVLIAELKKDVTGSDETIDESTQSAERLVGERLATILERERMRLAPIAAREHWVALGFAIVAGAIFFQSILLATTGTAPQAIITLVASLIPGFASTMFFSREAANERRLKEISNDLRKSEQMREKLVLLREALSIVPEDKRAALAERYIKIF
jgi:hypothetical protein